VTFVLYLFVFTLNTAEVAANRVFYKIGNNNNGKVYTYFDFHLYTHYVPLDGHDTLRETALSNWNQLHRFLYLSRAMTKAFAASMDSNQRSLIMINAVCYQFLYLK
jgi:hypothetical protein